MDLFLRGGEVGEGLGWKSWLLGVFEGCLLGGGLGSEEAVVFVVGGVLLEC